ncbi:unnamed protein product [marine sediment metagenome]|uniref:Uncharacterized protein n=1 Tax=marine sediment metagenome TaxID=412755 RepID=X0Z9Z4_9ZZZZ
MKKKTGKEKLTKEDKKFMIGVSGFMTALIFIVWIGSLAYYW